jgi:hypothetical protein
MSRLPDKVSHGGTYAGNRVAAAAAVKTLEILRDTAALETIHATGRRSRRPREILDPTGCRTTSRATRDVRDHVHARRRDRVPRLGDTDHELYDAIAIGMHARGAMPEPDSREPWFMCEAHAEGDIIDRVLTPSRTRSMRRSRRARTASAPTPHGGMAAARPAETGQRDAMVLDGNAVRSVDRAAALLLALGESQGEAGVTELARGSACTSPRPPAAADAPAPRAWSSRTARPASTGSASSSSASPSARSGPLDLRGIALPELERPGPADPRDDRLGILDGDTLLAVAQVDGPNLIAVGDWTGRATPLHCVASGQGPALVAGRARGPAHRRRGS